MSKTSNWPDPWGQIRDMSQIYSLWLHNGNFLGKTQNNKSIQICLNFCISTAMLSTLMTCVKNISNWHDPGGQIMDMSQIYPLWLYKGNFTGKTENNKSTLICLKDSLTNRMLSTLMTLAKNISNWPDPGSQIMDISEIIHYDHIRVIVLEKQK